MTNLNTFITILNVCKVNYKVYDTSIIIVDSETRINNLIKLYNIPFTIAKYTNTKYIDGKRITTIYDNEVQKRETAQKTVKDMQSVYNCLKVTSDELYYNLYYNMY